MPSSTKKKFDKELFLINDVPSKKIAIEYFNKLNQVAVENPNKYGIDLIVNEEFYCEVEVKHGWKGSYFPFKDLQISYRKKKFASLDKPVMFMVMNSTKTYALTVNGEDVITSPIKVVPNKYVPEGEQFYVVPFDKLCKIKLEL